MFFCAATAAYVSGSVYAYERGVFEIVETATGGLVDAALLSSAVALVAIVGGIVLGIGKLSAVDIGVRWRDLPVALAVTLALWILAQTATLFAELIGNGSLSLYPHWHENGLTWVLGRLIGQLCGNAPFEEIAYRGFLLPQIYLGVRATRVFSRGGELVAAVVVSQTVFALMHVPIRLHQGTAAGELPANLAATVFVGVFFCLVYLQTGNLFVTVGVHALINRPTPLMQSMLSPQLVVFILASLLLLVWPQLARLIDRTPWGVACRSAPANGRAS